MNTKEIYEMDGIVNGSRDIFTIMADGSLSYKTYIGDRIIEWDNPTLVPCGKGQRIQYGSGSSSPFKDYANGELDKKWTKIL
jgi:hypothetical protein